MSTVACRWTAVHILVGIVLMGAVLLLYRVAPCWTFGGWYPPSFFFGVIWRLLIPAIAVMAIFNIWRVLDAGNTRMLWIGWGVLTGLVLYGWITGYITTYVWWRTSGAPWPLFC